MTLTSILASPAFHSLQRLKSFFSAFTPAVLLMAGAHCLQAGPIPKLFNTGVDESGVLLAESQMDPHYTMTASADTNFPGPDAFTLMPGYPVGPWIEEGPNSRWIAPQADQSTGNSLEIGLSDTSDPNGSWHLYRSIIFETALSELHAALSGRFSMLASSP